jgi:hypothetical protein
VNAVNGSRLQDDSPSRDQGVLPVGSDALKVGTQGRIVVGQP